MINQEKISETPKRDRKKKLKPKLTMLVVRCSDEEIKLLDERALALSFSRNYMLRKLIQDLKPEAFNPQTR